MTTKANFSEKEWTTLARAPLVAGLGVTLADPGGLIEISKESMASLKAATVAESDEGLIMELAQGLTVMVQGDQNPLSDLKPEPGAKADAMVLDELREANRVISEKATPEEANRYRDWVIESAHKAAEAAKEGGFFGIGAVRVSEGEQTMLSKLESLLGPFSQMS